MNDPGRKKPTGRTGSLKIEFGPEPGQSKQTYSKVVFPTTKDEIEIAVLAAALNAPGNHFSIRQHFALMGDAVKNPENDFDFTLPTATGQTYLDLMEIALLEEVRGSHESARTDYKIGDRADAIASKILEKSSSYGAGPASGIHLMLYDTDFRFDAVGGVSDLLSHILHARSHCFKSIVYCSPDPKHTLTRLLFPLSDAERGALQPESLLRRITTVTFDLSQGIHVMRKDEMRTRGGQSEWNSS